MNKKLEFESVTKENIKIAFNIQNTIFPEENGNIEIYESISEPSQYIDYSEFFLPKLGEEYVGICGIYTYSAYPNEIWLDWFGVLSPYRRMGYGNQILDWVENFCKQKGYNTFRVYTDEIDNAHAVILYTKRGMIREKYFREDDIFPTIKTTLIFSKNFDGTPVERVNNRMLWLADQYEKETKAEEFLRTLKWN